MLAILIFISTLLEFWAILIIPISTTIFEIDQLTNFTYLNKYIAFFKMILVKIIKL